VVGGTGNVITLNEIAYNDTHNGADSAEAGVYVGGAAALGNTISANSIHDNDGPGIEDRVRAVVVTPDGRYAISASTDRTLKVWDISTELNAGLETGRELATVALEGMPNCITVAPDGVTTLAGDGAGNIYCLQYVEGNRATT